MIDRIRKLLDQLVGQLRDAHGVRISFTLAAEGVERQLTDLRTEVDVLRCEVQELQVRLNRHLAEFTDTGAHTRPFWRDYSAKINANSEQCDVCGCFWPKGGPESHFMDANARCPRATVVVSLQSKQAAP